MDKHLQIALDHVLQRISDAAAATTRPAPGLLAVSKTRSAQEIAEMAALLRGHGLAPAFGENYVQEAIAKQRQLADPGLCWHLIGHLQSNKAREAATHFDWVQSVDRPKLVEALALHRPGDRAPLNVLIQVNIDDETSKHGCAPEQIDVLADAIRAHPKLRLRGLMAIPAPAIDPAVRRGAFQRMRELFDALAARCRDIDTLSIGMSDDLELAIGEGSTMVRVGTALFGARDA